MSEPKLVIDIDSNAIAERIIAALLANWPQIVEARKESAAGKGKLLSDVESLTAMRAENERRLERGQDVTYCSERAQAAEAALTCSRAEIERLTKLLEIDATAKTYFALREECKRLEREVLRMDRENERLTKLLHSERDTVHAANENHLATRLECDRMRSALEEICIGKIAADNTHPEGVCGSMADRFLRIARAALKTGQDRTRLDVTGLDRT